MLKKLLSSFAKNPWKLYAVSVGADYIDGGFLHSDRIVAHHHFFSVIVSIGTNQRGNNGYRYTRFRCSYISNQQTYFSIKSKRFHMGFVKGLFSKKTTATLPIQKLYDISTPKEELISMLFEDQKFCTLLNTLSAFKFLSEKDDGEYGPDFLPAEHQLCLELEGEVEDAELLSAGIGIILATVELFVNNGLLKQEKSSVIY